MSVDRRRVYFTGPREADVLTEEVPSPAPGEVLVRTEYSAVSPGTERLVYEGKAPENLEADPSIDALKGEALSYPISYGYACVGTVEAVGKEVDDTWLGTRVFAFQPHVSHFVTPLESLIQLPESVPFQDAVLLPMVETAVNLVMDGRPMVGEKVIVFGQGVVGLLTTQLLSEHPLSRLIAVEQSPYRQSLSKDVGGETVAGSVSELKLSGNETEYDGADLVYELTGQPSVLNDAIQAAGFEGRIIVGSWYGRKRVSLDLGGKFHRSRLKIVSSQVSTISSAHRGRWSRARRMDIVLDFLRERTPSRLVTEWVKIDRAPSVYERLSAGDESMLQPVFRYSDSSS